MRGCCQCATESSRRLKTLKPFGNVAFELLDFGFDTLEGLLKGVVGEAAELMIVSKIIIGVEGGGSAVQGKRRSVGGQAPLAFAVRFRDVNSEFSVVDIQRL